MPAFPIRGAWREFRWAEFAGIVAIVPPLPSHRQGFFRRFVDLAFRPPYAIPFR